MSELRKAVAEIDAGLKEHLHPLLRSLNAIASAAREPIATVLGNLAEVSRVVRERTIDADAVVADVLERARVEIDRVDKLFAEILKKLERAADVVERGVYIPIRELSALVAGFRTGFDFLFKRRRPAAEASRQEEQLFI